MPADDQTKSYDINVLWKTSIRSQLVDKLASGGFARPPATALGSIAEAQHLAVVGHNDLAGEDRARIVE